MVYAIIKETAKDKHIIFLLRKQVLVWFKSDIYVKAQHLTSKEILQYDCLHCLKVN